MKRIKRTSQRRLEMSDDEIRARLVAAVESVRGMEIDDVFPGGYRSAELNRTSTRPLRGSYGCENGASMYGSHALEL